MHVLKTIRMPSVSFVANFLLAFLITVICGETQVQFAGQTDFYVNETSTTVIRLVIERTGVPTNITAIVLLEGENNGDFVETVTAAFIPDRETNRTVYISVCDDDIPEADETFHFLLILQNPPVNTVLGSRKVATVTILSNDNAFGIISLNMPSFLTVNEPRGKNQSVPLILIREKGTYGTVTVTFEIDGGPNPADEDLIPAKGNITFSTGASVLIYNLTIVDDQVPENDENFTLKLTDVFGGAEINSTRSSVQIIIRRNDSPVRFRQSSYIVPEAADVIIVPVTRGKDLSDKIISSDDVYVSINYRIVTGNSAASAQLGIDFSDLQPNNTIVFSPKVYEIALRFQIYDDTIPEIAESFQIILMEDTLQGDAVLQFPSVVYVTIEPNDKPYGVLSINSALFGQTVIIDEDQISRYEGITVVRNGGTHGNVSVNWNIQRNGSDLSPVTLDIFPASGVLHFTQGQMLATIPLTIISDNVPEEAEAYVLHILANTVQGGAEVGSPTELVFYVQDSDDIYGLIEFRTIEDQRIESSPEGRFLALRVERQGGTRGDVELAYSAFYIPAGPVDPLRAKDGILNISSRNSVVFVESNTIITLKLPIRNDAFLQNGAHFLIQLENCELLRPIPIVPPISPRLGAFKNVTLSVTPDIANGEIGFISNLPIIVSEPENASSYMVSIDLHRDGTGGEAVVFWSLKPSGFNANSITQSDLSPFNGSVKFLHGQNYTTINITIKPDDIPEVNETVIISLNRVETEMFVVYFEVNVENQILKSGFTSRELTILENDDPGGVFEFSPSSRGPFSVKEGHPVELRIARTKGILVKQFLRYTVEPKDSNEFYGNTGILEFKTGEKEIVITLLTRIDGIPELDEMYSVVLSSHGEFPTTLGEAKRVNITILENDDPHGVIEFISDGIVMALNESKGDYIHTVSFEVIRKQGHFGNINVSWIISPDSTQDVYPTQGILYFKEEEFSKNITISSLPDEIPEENETFILTLLNPAGGARLGNVITAKLEIRKNDDAVFFADPSVVFVEEGQVANFTVVRNGSADFVSSVMYSTVNGVATAEEGDFMYNARNILVFDIGQRLQNISVYTNEDDLPETDEPFYILLINATGDTVVGGNGKATVTIKANDDPNGIFFIEPVDKSVEEGSTNNFKVVRSRGHFGSVYLEWQLLQNNSALQPGQEFYESSGILWFNDGEQFKFITLHAVPDQIPEFNEFYTLMLVNISGGFPGHGGQLAKNNLSVTVMIPFNDDPFGVFVISPESQNRDVAEDVLSEDDMSYVTNFSIWRHQGTFGDVRVGWELLSSTYKNGLPPMLDFLLLASFPSSVQLLPHMRRHHSGTDALYFSGAEDAFGIVEPQYYHTLNNTLANFTFSAWAIPDVNTNGFIISKDNDVGIMYFGVKVETNESYIVVMLCYTVFGSNTTYTVKVEVPKSIEQKNWIHIVITLDDGFIEFYIDGSPVPGGVKSLKGEAIINGPGTLRVGAGLNGNSRFTGMLQDVRLYAQKLSHAEIAELHATPAKSDLHPVSGYLEYRQGETHKSFIVSARDDSEEEGEELFILKLVSVYGGARIPEENTTAVITIQKSDNANGLFGFTGPCIPQSSEEGSTISCVVERTRGALDTVYLFYTITQTDSSRSNGTVLDFTSSSGNITFPPMVRSKVLNLNIVDDEIPELAEYFRITLVSAVSADGKIGSTPTSGASIDPDKKDEDIIINASDHPYGLLQFSVGNPPKPDDEMTVPAKSVPTIRVKEEIGEVWLLVIRAQGLLGHIRVEYRTVSLTAFSPNDYKEIVGVLQFQPGERYKYISVNITDNSIPELAKSFRVELWNADGEVAELFRNGGSGSGDGDMEFFLPAVHQRASLGIASHIVVIIEDSDDAHGVFEFSRESLYVNATEPDYGYRPVTFQVLRDRGALSKVFLFWSIELDPEEDLAFNSGNITFEIGQKSANLTIYVSPDDIPELDKLFSVLLTKVSSGRLGHLTNASLTIFANDDPYGLFIFSESNRPLKVVEKNQNITLTIRRLRGLMGTVMVTYTTIPDSEKIQFFPLNIARATQWKDYLPVSGHVLFMANVSEANIFLPILDDNDPERSESLFVELLNVTLIEKEQNQPVFDSPRLGSRIETIAQIIINASDDAFGVLQFSTTYVRVAESYVGPIINVTRTGGMFADVSVKFIAVPITATAGEDYSVASSDVVLLEGETSKAVPIYIINDINPEIEESFKVMLLNQTTGGAFIGTVTEATIIIEASDDPYGSFVFQVTSLTVDEPEYNTVKVKLPIIRNAGILGNVTLQWIGTINGQLATGDLQVASGNVTFAAGETIKDLSLEIMADNIPEDDEIIHIKLTGASNGGSIGSEGLAKITIPANDNPYGIITFHRSEYRVQEPLEQRSFANITIRRSAGRFGRLHILYSTTEIDVVGLSVEQGQDMLSYYELPIRGIPLGSLRTDVNVSLSGNPLQTCATRCLKNQVCSAFSFSNASGIPTCFWVTTLSNLFSNDTGFWTYKKNSTSVSVLFSTQATAGSDYETVTGQWFTMLEGEEFANLTVSILTDTFPELDERFIVSLLDVKLLNISTSLKNQPTIGQPSTSVVVIMMNGDAFGVFVIYTLNPNAMEKGHHLEMEEQSNTIVQLIIERREGSLGQVAVEWDIVEGTATENVDFIADNKLLIFAEGETKKTVTLTIMDDSEPEDNESIIIRLTQTDGGSRILPSSNTVTIVILANDNVAGVISFQTASRSQIGREGEKLQFHVLRTFPGSGNVTVYWKIIGSHLELNFENSSGMLFFPEGSLNASFLVHLLDDQIPEEKEEYQLILYNVITQGVSGTGVAVLDNQGYEAVLTVEASDEPYGVLNFAPSSRIILTQEGNKTIQLFINREYGALGDINITYTTTSDLAHVMNKTDSHPAEPGLDYIPASGSLIMQDGETTAVINVSILEDDVPELQEYFFISLISVELIVKVVTSSPPRLDIEGLTSQIIIDANDGIQGVIEWQSTSYEINETQGLLTLVAYRNKGTHGNVSLFFYAQNLGAQLGMDYNATSMSLTFADGEKYKFIDIIINDDDIPEGDESFQLILANPSHGLDLGLNTTATVTILANDDGHGILSFNNSEHFYLREPTAMYMAESVALLYIIREPPQGIFGTVTVQYLVIGENASNADGDLSPVQGYVILEEGVRFKTLEISAVLDEEPEMDEHFMVTLLNPTGGARLGTRIHTSITVLQNQAPQGLFSIFPVHNKTNSITVEESNMTVYLKVSRSNGLNLSVSVEWETLSGSALGIRGPNSVLSVLQSFQDEAASTWCFFRHDDIQYGVLLRTLPLSPSSKPISTIYAWRGVFVPIQDFILENPLSCEAFAINGSQFLVITNGKDRPGNNNVYTFTLKHGLSLEVGKYLCTCVMAAEGLVDEVRRLLAAGGEDWLREQLALMAAGSSAAPVSRPVRRTRARPPVRLSPGSGRERRRSPSPGRRVRGRRSAAGASSARRSLSPRSPRERRSEAAEGRRSGGQGARRLESGDRSRSRSHPSPGVASQAAGSSRGADGTSRTGSLDAAAGVDRTQSVPADPLSGAGTGLLGVSSAVGAGGGAVGGLSVHHVLGAWQDRALGGLGGVPSAAGEWGAGLPGPDGGSGGVASVALPAGGSWGGGPGLGPGGLASVSVGLSGLGSGSVGAGSLPVGIGAPGSLLPGAPGLALPGGLGVAGSGVGVGGPPPASSVPVAGIGLPGVGVLAGVDLVAPQLPGLSGVGSSGAPPDKEEKDAEKKEEKERRRYRKIPKVFGNWIRAFSILASVIAERFPSKCSVLFCYQDTIWSACRIYGGLAWWTYDEQFRQRMALRPAVSWDQLDIGLWLSLMTRPAGSPMGLQSFQAGAGGLGLPATSSSASKRAGFCWQFNDGHCKWGSSCKFRHECSGCSGSHPFAKCFKKSRGGEKGGSVGIKGEDSGVRRKDGSLAKSWVVRKEAGFSSILHYLDDFLCVGPGGLAVCRRLLDTLERVCSEFGVPLAREKTEGPTTCLCFLGIELDSVSMECRLPSDKLSALLGEVLACRRARKVSLWALQSLLGKLNFASRIIPMGRVFSRRLSQASGGALRSHHHIRLTLPLREDLRVWEQFLVDFNGRSYWQSPVQTNGDLDLYTDAAGSVGFGAIFGSDWCSGLWPEVWVKVGLTRNILFLELFPIVVAVSLWGERMRDCRIVFHSDNMGVVQSVNNLSASSPPVLALLRRLVLCCLRLNLSFRARHVPGVLNVAADALSRFQVAEFRKAWPGAKAEGTPCPLRGWSDFTKAFSVRMALRGLRRGSVSRDSRRPVSFQLLRRLVDVLPSVCRDDFEQCLFVAAYCLAFFGALRIGAAVLRVWIVGHSFVFWARRRAAVREHGLQMSLDGSVARVSWFGYRGLRWSQFLPLISRLVSMEGSAPHVLAVHLGGNDLGAVPVWQLGETIKGDLESLLLGFPGLRVVWSEIIPRRFWARAHDPTALDKGRIRLNRRVSRFVVSRGGFAVRHRVFEDRELSLFREDEVHPNDLGWDFFNLELSGALEQATALIQTITVPETSGVKHFSVGNQDYLTISSHVNTPEASQVFKWHNGLFTLYQKLPSSGTLGLTLFTRGEIIYLVLVNSAQKSYIYTWTNGQFGNPQEVLVNGATHVESLASGADIYIIISEVHILFAGKNGSALYSLNPEGNQFSPLLLAPASKHLTSLTVNSLNSNKTIIARAGEFNSEIFELTSVSNQSDFIPSSGELKFEPGESEVILAVNILDDLIPEEEESFTVRLKNAKGGAEIGANNRVTIIIPTNDNAHGVIGFAQSSLMKQVEEMDQDNLISFSIERLHGTYGRVVVEWFANGSITDIFPSSGVVTFSDGQALTTITVTVIADNVAELTETVTVMLTRVTTVNIRDPMRGATLDPKRSKAVLVILPNDSPHGIIGWHINSSTVKVDEPEGKSTVVTLQVIREQGFVGDIAVQLQSVPNLSLPPTNQAIGNQDYIAKDEMIIIKENKTFASVQITILPDDIPELHEGFLLNITGVHFVNTSVSSGQPTVRRPGAEIAEITILENDEPRGIFQFNVTKDINGAVAGYEVPPPQNVLRLPVVRQAGRFGSVNVFWEAKPITASLEDFSPSSGNLTFSDGQAFGTIEIFIVDDTYIEFLETFSVSLKQLTNEAKFGNETTIMVNIPPNDSPLGVFGFEEKTVTVREPKSIGDPAGEVTLTVVRSKGGRGAVTVIWLLEESAQYDLKPLNGTLIYNESDTRKSFTLFAIQDGLLEGEEKYSVQLVSSDYSVISPVDGTATVIISGDTGSSGVVGIAASSHHILIGEPFGNYNGTAHVSLVRGPGIFGEVTVHWNITPAHYSEFVEVSGILTMRDKQSAAVVIIQAVNDNIPEEKSYYQFQLSAISNGGVIDESSRLANITMASSDLPYGHFEFSQTLVQISEEEKWVNVTVIRYGGTFGEVQLKYNTLNGSALSDVDFTATYGELIFRPNETMKIVSVEIQNDALPEGPEDFFVIINTVKLLGRDYDHTFQENGLQIDQPPTIGNNSAVRIIILKNDNAEGIIQFDPDFVAFQVEEDIGTFVIPVMRIHGSYGYVTADFISHSISALPNGIDYTISNTSVIFQHGQQLGFINISITDDDDSEFAEQFEIRLVGASGGAVLGYHLVSLITIAKSDSPNGLVRFLNQSQIMLPNPNVSLSLLLALERTGGLQGEAQIVWKILGPNSKEILPTHNDDFSEPLNGSFYFNDGEGGIRTINLTILPHGEIEVEEKFIILLSTEIGNTEIDPKAGNVTLIIKKFGDPNGIVQFAAESLVIKNYTEPEASEGPLNIILSVKRVQGILGNLTVHWQLSSASDIEGDFTSTAGSVFIPDKKTSAEIVIQLLPDDVPEIDETCFVQLIYVEGGADLDIEKSVSQFTVLGNDDPHGLFAVYPAGQSIIVTSDLSRYVQVNITRLAGTFGNVTVEYQISFAQEDKENLTDTIVGIVLIKDGARYGVSTVPISNQIFLVPGFNFSLELTNVKLMGVSTFGMPQILKGQKPTSISVPKDAANAEIGFESSVFQLTNITSGQGQAVISRTGLYGSVAVSWRSGYPQGLLPENIRLGKITPESGVVVFMHGEDTKFISLHLEANTSGPEAFALQLLNLSSNVPSGARLKPGFTLAEFEPMGLFQFSSNSKHVVVGEDVQKVSLHLQRLYGFQGNKTILRFQTIPGSAKALEDYVPIDSGEVIFEKYHTSSTIEVSIIDDNIYEPDELFYLNLTSVESVGAYRAKPRLNFDSSLSSITILANDFLAGFVSIGPAVTYVEEDTNNSALNTVSIHVKRTHGLSGIVHVTLVTFGSIHAKNGLKGLPFEYSHGTTNLSWATEGLDFEEQSILITLLDGESEKNALFRILDDEEPEGLEVFYALLKDPQGGVQLTDRQDENGYASFSTIIIKGNDLQNGILGFAMESQEGLKLDEDSAQRTVKLLVFRQRNRAFEAVKILWRATFNKTSVELLRDGVNLVNELQAVSGYTICTAGQTECIITVEIKPDKVPEFETYFFVELYEVGAGASINSSARFAKIIILESDSPRGLIYFAVGSREAVAHKKTTSISLQISRESSTSQSISVGFITQELKKAEIIGHTTISPAVAGRDFVKYEGVLTFEPGQVNVILEITLTPDIGSLNPFPKRFQVLLVEPSGGAKLDPLYGIANITILSDASSQSTWGLIDQLYQPYEESIFNRVLQALNNKAVSEVSKEQLGAMMNIMEKIIHEAEIQVLSNESRALFYDTLCSLASPERLDTRGYSPLIETAEKYAFSLLTGVDCGSPGEKGKTILDTCPHLYISAYHWYPQQINGHKFEGKNGDSIQVPERLLAVPSVSTPTEDSCKFVQYTEYSSQQWFLTGGKQTALNNKVLSVSLKGQSSYQLPSDNEVVYRIYASGDRIVPRMSLCLLWNQGSERWLSNGQFCKIVSDATDYVECACTHMSSYAVYAETDKLSSYNEAFFCAGFICISGFTLAILSQLFCTRNSMFAAKLLTHMMVACLGTQISFLASAYTSRELSDESCSGLASITHYFFLSQFVWMLIQAVNFWYVLVMNDENAENRHLIFFIIGWGLPAVVVILHLVILKSIYHKSMTEIYGLVHGDMCFIPNVYAALFTACLVPLVCLVVVLVVFIHAYQVTQQWKAYDDVFRGRPNATEIPLILCLFALISISWLWGGLHMAYRDLWMLVLLIIFNSLQGLYVFVVYFILHNQLCCPVKASYSIDVDGHRSPASAFFTPSSGMPPAGGEISKSTQNLISAMEEISADWERSGGQTIKQSPQNGAAFTTSGGYSNGSVVADEELQEFDDLIFVLKAGSGLNISDTESCHGSQDGGSMANSQIVELRRIPIADTHL
ncbi:adhesion G-protein coupled receptor V1 [Rhinophrynus dorsalis]